MTQAASVPRLQLTLIIPAYNEEAIIASTVAELDAYMKVEQPRVSFEIVVVDDGSKDRTTEVLAGHESPSLRVIRHSNNRGRGAAVRTGFAAAKGDYIICLDSDLSYAPWHIPRLLAPLVLGEADITLASAYHRDGKVENVPAFRALLSRYGNRLLSRGLYGQFRTLTCLVRGYRREVVEELELISDGKDLHIEILQKASLFGMRIVEVPATLKWRSKTRARRVGRGFAPFAMSGQIAAHLVYNYVLRPGLLFTIPLWIMLLVVAGGSLTLLISWIGRIVASAAGFPLSLYTALRATVIDGAITLAVVALAAVISLFILGFYFASQQNKRQFEELYVLLSRTNRLVKQLEAKASD